MGGWNISFWRIPANCSGSFVRFVCTSLGSSDEDEDDDDEDEDDRVRRFFFFFSLRLCVLEECTECTWWVAVCFSNFFIVLKVWGHFRQLCSSGSAACNCWEVQSFECPILHICICGIAASAIPHVYLTLDCACGSKWYQLLYVSLYKGILWYQQFA